MWAGISNVRTQVGLEVNMPDLSEIPRTRLIAFAAVLGVALLALVLHLINPELFGTLARIAAGIVGAGQ